MIKPLQSVNGWHKALEESLRVIQIWCKSRQRGLPLDGTQLRPGKTRIHTCISAHWWLIAWSEHFLLWRDGDIQFVCLFGFLTSSSTTKLYRRRVPRLMSDNFTCCDTWDRAGRPWPLTQPVTEAFDPCTEPSI